MTPYRSSASRPITAVLLAVACATILGACGQGDARRADGTPATSPAAFEIHVVARVEGELSSTLRATVEGPGRVASGDRAVHRLELTSSRPVNLGSLRLGARADGEQGTLLLAGEGSGWTVRDGAVQGVETMNFREVTVSPEAPAVLTLAVLTELGPVLLGAGRYEVAHPLPGGILRLVYDVRAA